MNSQPLPSSLRCAAPLTASVALSLLAAGALRADDPAPTPPASQASAEVETEADRTGAADATAPPEAEADVASDPSIYDKIWRFAKWYENEENNVIQSFLFTGRFQLDYATIDADQGSYEEWNVRRFRLGAKATLFHDFKIHGEVDLNPQEGESYQRITDAYVAWTRYKNYEVTVGKQSAGFTLDGQTSSKKLLTIDRSNLANNLWFTEEYIPGVTLTGEPDRWVYQVGAFSSAAEDNEFGNISGGIFGLATMGYNFKEALNAKQALLRFNYVYNAPQGTSRQFANRPLEQIGSINFVFDREKWGVWTDLSGGLGYEQASDVWGASILPYYNFSRNFQLVTRYTFVRSIDENGVRLPRYENQFVSGRGDEFQEIYLGLNWYLYGHKLKLQTGVDYAHMADRANDGGTYNGWQWTTGLRLYW
jgi:phosphate-selective porin OprO/OprP